MLDRTWTLHGHDRPGFEARAAGAGLATEAVVDRTGRPAPADAHAFKDPTVTWDDGHH